MNSKTCIRCFGCALKDAFECLAVLLKGTSLLIWCLNALLQDRFDQYMNGCFDGDTICLELLSGFEEWVFTPETHLITVIFDLFATIEHSLASSDSKASVSKDLNPESMSLIHSYARRISVGFTIMSFEQVCDLATEFQIYARGLPHESHVQHRALSGHIRERMVYKNASKIEEILEKEIVDLRAGIRNKQSILDTLEKQCNDLHSNPASRYSKSVLHARSAVASEKMNDIDTIDCVYEFSDAPESSATRRVFVEEEDLNDSDISRRTIIEAALNVAIVQAKLGQMQEAMQMVKEHMRVSQQSSNRGFLVYSLAALCYILSRAVPGSIELQSGIIPGTTPAERHYLETEELLKRLFTRSQEENLPEISVFAKLLSTELAILHPKKQADTSLGTFDRMHQTKDVNQNKDMESSSPGFPRLQMPCVAATESLDTCIYTKCLAFELALLSAGGQSKANAALYMPPKASGSQPFSRSDSRKTLDAIQMCQVADQIRAAGWQIWGSSRLSLSSALRVLHSATKNSESELSSLSLILINLYDQYGAEPIDRLSLNETLTSLIQKNTDLQRSWDIIKQKKAVNTRQSRLAIKLAARVHIHAKMNDVMHIQNKVECRELTALAYLSGGYYNDADKSAVAGYTLARNACMSEYALRLLLLRGRIHVESGSWETALPHICSVLEQYRQMNADLIGAEASMYMAQIWSRMGSKYIKNALEEINTSIYLILAHGSLETKGLARVTLARLLIMEKGGFSSIDQACSKRILRLLRDAEVDFSKIRDWKYKAYVLHLASIVYDHMGNVDTRDKCATTCIQLRQLMHQAPSHMFIKSDIHI